MISFKSLGRGGLACAIFILTTLGAVAETAQSPAGVGPRFNDPMLAKIKADPENKPANQRFTFVVLGDRTNTIGPFDLPTAENPATKVFQEILKEADLLSPSFVLFVGDLIEGYDRPEVISREWDEILPIAGAGKTPLVAVLGNHDVQNQDTKQIWLDRVGDRYFSFDFANSHFICLDSEEESEQGAAKPKAIIPDQQIAWLKSDLEAHKNAANIFVALHEPFFIRDQEEDYPDSNWDKVHAILTKYPVRVVFAGHEHEYRMMTPRDGIDYVISGGGGGELEGHPEQGQFFHYLLVKVDGKKVSWSVIRPGSVLPPDVMTEALRQQFTEADKLIRVTPAISPEVMTASSVPLAIAVRNPSKMEATINLSWESPNAAWQVTPETAQLVAPAGEERSATFTLQAKSADWFAGPLPLVRVEIPILGGSIVVRKSIEQMDFLLNCPSARQPITIDGDLADWQGVPAFWVRPPFDTANWSPADASGTFRMMWDKQWVYISAEMKDDIQITTAAAAEGYEDNVGFAFKKVPGGPDYYSLILVMVNGESKLLRNEREPSGHWVTNPIPGSKVKIVRQEGRTIYEAAIPRKEIFPEVPAAGTGFQTALSWGDLDNDNAPQVVGYLEAKTEIK